MQVCLHDTGHRCVVTNTQHSWSHWCVVTNTQHSWSHWCVVTNTQHSWSHWCVVTNTQHSWSHWCVVTNTQHSWSHWLQCRTKMEARCHARRAAVGGTAGGRPYSLRLSSSVVVAAEPCAGVAVYTALCVAVSWPACPYRTVCSSVLAGLSLPHCV